MGLKNGMTIVGYKLARGNRLVVLQIPPSARHNMDRPGVADKQFAKHRCSEAFVTDIIDLTTGKSVEEARSLNDSSFKYVVGRKVTPGIFDEDVKKVCTGGIHFFLNRRRAEMYDFPVPRDGEYKSWHDNGNVLKHCHYKDGKLEGEYKEWYDDGNILKHCHYKDGKLEGEYKEWYDDRASNIHCFYKDGELEGEYEEWCDEGRLYIHCFYKDGELEGEYKEWCDDGILYTRCFYKDGKLKIN